MEAVLPLILEDQPLILEDLLPLILEGLPLPILMEASIQDQPLEVLPQVDLPLEDSLQEGDQVLQLPPTI